MLKSQSHSEHKELFSQNKPARRPGLRGSSLKLFVPIKILCPQFWENILTNRYACCFPQLTFWIKLQNKTLVLSSKNLTKIPDMGVNYFFLDLFIVSICKL